MHYGWRYFLEVGIWLTVSAWALARGGAAPRLVAGAIVAAILVVGVLGRSATPYRVHLVAWGADAAVLLACLVARRWSQRRWLLVAVAGQILSLLTHGAKMMDPTIRGWGYVTLVELWGVLVLGSLLVGTHQERRA